MTIAPSVRQMQAIVAVARLGSFSRAAVELGMSQSALSQSIQQLEFLLDAKLLERRHRSVTMTASGEVFVLRVERVLRDLETAVKDVRHQARTDGGRVSVACLSTVATLFMPEAVQSFRKDYPHVSISIRDENVAGILDQVKSGAVDFAVTCLFSDDRDVDFSPVIRDRFRFVCHLDHPWVGRRAVRWKELREINLVAMSEATGVRQIIERRHPDGRVFEHAAYEVSRVPSLVQIVLDGSASSVLPALSLATIRPGERAWHCRMIEPEIDREVGILTAHGAVLSTLAKQFLDHFVHVVATGNHTSHVPDIEILVDEQKAHR